MGGVLLINPRSGDDRPSADELREEALERGIDARLLEPGADATELAREADADAVGIAGGDGSLAAVAAAAIERDLPFVCVPFGTRNHFARDVGLDRNDPIAALDAFAGGVERRVDVGAAGDRIFLNNVSLGLYAQLVHRREHHRRRRETLARLRALAIAARRRPPLGITIDGSQVHARIVLVANNDYALSPFSIDERERLDEGCLYLYAARGLLRSTWEERRGDRFTIDAAAHRLAAAIDGEPVVLDTPIEFEARPSALRVLLPPGLDHERDVREGDLVARR